MAMRDIGKRLPTHMALGLLAASLPGVIGCDGERAPGVLADPTPNVTTVGEPIWLGRLAGVSNTNLNLRQLGNNFLLVVGGDSHSSVVEHIPDPSVWQPGKAHTFSEQKIEGGPGALCFIVTVDGAKYICVYNERYIDLKPLSKPEAE